MYLLSNELIFPAQHLANRDGILALGGDLSVARLKLAYTNGIFPWYNEGEPIVWYCPDPRMVLFPDRLRVTKSMKKLIDSKSFSITENSCFEAVISACKSIDRPGQGGTWITDDMEQAYLELHEAGMAKSVEVWQNEELVGGLYGIDLGTVFCGESMFSVVSNASKVGFVHLVRSLQKKNYALIDCQVYNTHLESLGAEEISRTDFLNILKENTTG